MDYKIYNAVHAKHGHIAKEMYGTKVAKELRRLFRKSWNGGFVSPKAVFFAMKRAKEAREERRAA
jgi:hypothetical protein